MNWRKLIAILFVTAALVSLLAPIVTAMYTKVSMERSDVILVAVSLLGYVSVICTILDD